MITMPRIQQEIMQDSCMIDDNHARIQQEIMQESNKNYARCSKIILACYLICTQDSQGNYARNVQKQYKKIMQENFKNHATFLHNF